MVKNIANELLRYVNIKLFKENTDENNTLHFWALNKVCRGSSAKLIREGRIGHKRRRGKVWRKARKQPNYGGAAVKSVLKWNIRVININGVQKLLFAPSRRDNEFPPFCEYSRHGSFPENSLNGIMILSITDFKHTYILE